MQLRRVRLSARTVRHPAGRCEGAEYLPRIVSDPRLSGMVGGRSERSGSRGAHLLAEGVGLLIDRGANRDVHGRQCSLEGSHALRGAQLLLVEPEARLLLLARLGRRNMRVYDDQAMVLLGGHCEVDVVGDERRLHTMKVAKRPT